MTYMVTDPITNEKYEYGLGTDNNSYVLKAIIELGTCRDKFGRYSSSVFMEKDVDGGAFGVDCNDPAYCEMGVGN